MENVMKKLNALLTLSAALALGSFVNAQFVQNFESFAVGDITHGSGGIQGTITNANPVFRTGAASGATAGSRTFVDESENTFARLSRNFRATQSLTIAQLITVSDAGLTHGQEYTLSFDYRIGRVGTIGYGGVDAKFAILQDNGGFAQYTGIEGNFANAATPGTNGESILKNYADVTSFTTLAAASQPVTEWTTFTFTETFTLTAGNPTFGWALSVRGLGHTGNWDAANHTYIDIDNISITAIPEPSTLVLLGIALGSMWFFRRRKS